VGLCGLAGLEELDVSMCGLTALPEGIGLLVGLKKLVLNGNMELTALPARLCALVVLEEPHLIDCGLTALPEEIGALTGLPTLNLFGNEELAALPAGLGRLCKLEHLSLWGCPGLDAMYDLQQREGLPVQLARLAAPEEGGLRRRRR
jgi:Leucine-rich repeat (LRR) protein